MHQQRWLGPDPGEEPLQNLSLEVYEIDELQKHYLLDLYTQRKAGISFGKFCVEDWPPHRQARINSFVFVPFNIDEDSGEWELCVVKILQIFVARHLCGESFTDIRLAVVEATTTIPIEHVVATTEYCDGPSIQHPHLCYSVPSMLVKARFE
jgi:hypothetical protein